VTGAPAVEALTELCGPRDAAMVGTMAGQHPGPPAPPPLPRWQGAGWDTDLAHNPHVVAPLVSGSDVPAALREVAADESVSQPVRRAAELAVALSGGQGMPVLDALDQAQADLHRKAREARADRETGLPPGVWQGGAASRCSAACPTQTTASPAHGPARFPATGVPFLRDGPCQESRQERARTAALRLAAFAPRRIYGVRQL
jgi:hypothetical protein